MGYSAAPARTARARRARYRSARHRPGPAGPDGAGADRDDRSRLLRHRVRGRLLEHPPVQRHDPPDLRPDARPRCAAVAAAPTPRSPPRCRAVAPARRSGCVWPTASPTAPTACWPTWRSPPCPGVEEFDHDDDDLSPHPPAARTARASWRSRRATTTSRARCALDDLRDLPAAVARARWLLDLDADPVAVDGHLSEEPALASGHRPRPRPPGAPHAPTVASWRCAPSSASRCPPRRRPATPPRLVETVGDVPLESPDGSLTHVFPTPAARRHAPDDCLRMPERRRGTVRRRGHDAGRAASSDSNRTPTATRPRPGSTRSPASAPGRSRSSPCGRSATRTPSCPTTSGVRRAAAQLGFDQSPGGLAERSARWRPWRAYATQYLWAALDHPVATLRRHA